MKKINGFGMTTDKYEDIIELPYQKSATRPHMSIAERAAQFSPFAALTGHEAAIAETARLTDARMEPDEDMREALDRKMAEIRTHLKHQPEVLILYFKPDLLKEGGSYETHRGPVKKIDEYRQVLIFADGTEVGIDDIVDIEVMPGVM